MAKVDDTNIIWRTSNTTAIVLGALLDKIAERRADEPNFGVDEIVELIEGLKTEAERVAAATR